MLKETIAQGDLLYHSVHGLCRVDDIAKESQSGKEVLRYSLVPKIATKMKVRFVIAHSDMKASGFHGLILPKEADEVLKYLAAGNIKAAPTASPAHQVWELAAAILSFSGETMEVKDQRKRQMLERSVKGLVRELSLVFKMTLKDTAALVRKNLGSAPKINQSVLLALTRASED